MIAKNRDKTATKLFLNKAIVNSGKPKKVTIDKSGANNAALKSINENQPKRGKIEIRQIKYRIRLPICQGNYKSYDGIQSFSLS